MRTNQYTTARFWSGLLLLPYLSIPVILCVLNHSCFTIATYPSYPCNSQHLLKATYNSTRVILLHFLYCFSLLLKHLLQLAVLGACKCRLSNPEPCGCAHAAANLRKEVAKLREEVSSLVINLEKNNLDLASNNLPYNALQE